MQTANKKKTIVCITIIKRITKTNKHDEESKPMVYILKVHVKPFPPAKII